jgi:hypothetical protein
MQDEMSPRCEMFMYMMHMWVVYALLDWVQVELLYVSSYY